MRYQGNTKRLAVGVEAGGQVLDLTAVRREFELPGGFTLRAGFLDDSKVFVLTTVPQSRRQTGTVEVIGEGAPFGQPRLGRGGRRDRPARRSDGHGVAGCAGRRAFRRAHETGRGRWSVNPLSPSSGGGDCCTGK